MIFSREVNNFVPELFHRINNIKSILANKKLPDDTRNIWEQKLHNIAVNEDEYNKRVFEIFKDVKQGIFTDVT